MDVYISFEEKVTAEDSYNLKQLATLIQDECDLSVTIKKQEAETGVRDGGLAMGIAIASLAIAVFQTLISVLQYWESHQSTYDLFIVSENRKGRQKLLLKNASAADVKAIISQLQTEPTNKQIEFHIIRRR
ncbi:MAG: hypothetical protein V7L02_16165 [Nostoc sp.]|uniref:hypothetical protein n=1 Tax=Nostoc sp. TaxID=1180 RepID=UPI002FFCA42D